MTLEERLKEVLENGSDKEYIKFITSLSYEEYGEVMELMKQ